MGKIFAAPPRPEILEAAELVQGDRVFGPDVRGFSVQGAPRLENVLTPLAQAVKEGGPNWERELKDTPRSTAC